MFKKILVTLGVLAVLTGAVIGIRALNSRQTLESLFTPTPVTVIDNASLRALEGEGYMVADENDALRLLVSLTDGNIQVVNKENGYVWRSCPTEEEMASESSNKLWKNNLCSPVMFTYTTSASSTDTKYTNPLSQDSRVTVYEMTRGVRVFFEFLTSNVTFAYDICLDGSGLRVDIPSYLISDPGEVYKYTASGKKSVDKKASCLVVDFFLFPSLGAARTDNGTVGAMLVPDGTGALMDFQSDKIATSQYIAHVYGADMALYNGYDTQLDNELQKPSVCYPMFGVIREGNTMLAVIDQGETQADIVASKAGVQTGFNTVGARFVYRMKYKVITNSASGTGYLSYTDFAVSDQRTLLYYFGTGDYVDMAQTYRTYIQNKYGLHQAEQSAAPRLQLYLVGGDVESNMLTKTMIPVTTFTQAADILSYFKNQGIDAMDVVYSGWAKWGESVQVQDRFPVPSQLGGEAGLRALAEQAAQMNARLYLTDDHLSLNTHRGVSVSQGAVYNIQNNPLFNGAFADAALIQRNYLNAAPTYERLGVSGLEEEGLGWLLMTNYAKGRAATREQMKNAQRTVLTAIRDDFGSLRLEGARVWALMDGVTLTAIEGFSYLNVLDESVPFYTIAIHGLVDYLCGNYMEFYEPREQLLQAVANGGNVAFTLSWDGTEKLALSDSADDYSTQFSLWREDVLAVYGELLPYLEKTYGRLIEDHQTLSPGVTVTQYERGVRVVVNNTGSRCETPYGALEARTFIVVEGDE